MTARTVAVRGTSWSKRDFTEEVPGAGVDGLRARVDREPATADDVEAVAGVAGVNHDLPGRDVDLDEMRGDPLLGDE